MRRTWVFNRALIVNRNSRLNDQFRHCLHLTHHIIMVRQRAATIRQFYQTSRQRRRRQVLGTLKFISNRGLSRLFVAFRARSLFFSDLPQRHRILKRVTGRHLFTVRFNDHLLRRFKRIRGINRCPLTITTNSRYLKRLRIIRRTSRRQRRTLLTPSLTVATRLRSPHFPNRFILVRLLRFYRQRIRNSTNRHNARQTFNVKFDTNLRPNRRIVHLLDNRRQVLIQRMGATRAADERFATRNLNLFTITSRGHSVNQRRSTRLFAILNRSHRALLSTVR